MTFETLSSKNTLSEGRDNTELEILADIIGESPDKAIALAAVFISLMTFFTMVHQNWLIRRHDRLSVKPLLGIHADFNLFAERNSGQEHAVVISLSNRGLGPAIITKLDLRFISCDGQTQAYTNVRKLFEDHFKERLNDSDCTANILDSEATNVAPNESKILLSFKFSDSREDIQHLQWVADELNNLSGAIYYSSIYGKGDKCVFRIEGLDITQHDSTAASPILLPS